MWQSAGPLPSAARAVVAAAATALLLAAAARAPGVAAVDPAFARNITVFHINPAASGPVPLNMDVGDAAGDVFFDLFEVIAWPLTCANGTSSTSGHDCTNPESHGDDLVVTQLVLEVDARFGPYAKCNIGRNGTDGHGHKCDDGSYCCYCEAPLSREPVPCNASVGFENVTQHFGGRIPEWCDTRSLPGLATCWQMRAAAKFGGGEFFAGWYSPLDLGCADPLHPDASCTWRVVSVDAVINRTCHADRFFAAVAQYNQSCFDACPGTNTSDVCHITCFYETVLGPDASAHHGVVNMTTGVPTPELVQAWLSGFRPEDQGGCPRAPRTTIPSPPRRSRPTPARAHAPEWR